MKNTGQARKYGAAQQGAAHGNHCQCDDCEGDVALQQIKC